jgi:hypothetical protein
MKKFLIKTTIFIAILVSYFGINAIVNVNIYQKQDISGLKNKRVLIVGDSHCEKGVNPQYFASAQNISQNAEPYMVTYWKLKKVLETNTPDTVILGLAPHNISQFNDYKFSEPTWSSEMFKRCYTIEEFEQLPNNIVVDYTEYYKTVWKQIAFYPKSNHVHYLGHYSNNKLNKISNWEGTIKRHYYNDKKELGVSETSIRYLELIMELCDAKDIVLVLVSHSVHENYLKNIPPKIMKKYDLLMEEYAKKYIVFNKTKEKYPDGFYLNSDHLNQYGASRFTEELAEYLGTSNYK